MNFAFTAILCATFADGILGNPLPSANRTARYYGYQYDQLLECFDGKDGHGSSIKFDYPIKDLWSYGWDNRFSSCCFTGFWFLYEHPNFNRYHSNVSTYYSTTFCNALFVLSKNHKRCQ